MVDGVYFISKIESKSCQPELTKEILTNEMHFSELKEQIENFQDIGEQSENEKQEYQKCAELTEKRIAEIE